jgi:hypothetical protein
MPDTAEPHRHAVAHEQKSHDERGDGAAHGHRRDHVDTVIECHARRHVVAAHHEGDQ